MVHPDFVVASFSSNEARILRRSDWACLQTFHVPATSVECADVAVDGATLLTGLGDYTVRLWDATTGECELFFETPRTNFNLHRRVRLFGDHILLVDFVGNIKVWDRFTGELTLSFARDDHNFVDWDATADGLISLSLDGCIHLWNFATRLCCVVVLGDENAHPRVGRIVSDGKRVAVNWHHDGPRGGTDVWDFETGDIIVNLPVSSLNAIHLIGNLLVGVLSVARKIQLWDIETGQNIRCFNFDAFSSISAQVSCSALFLSESIRGRASEAAVLDFGEDIPFCN
ncbi:WD40-repeat-containing domain protein [Zopfochytrium polystomum]|nr:WD40-repeat-containing domain protein [Zopfochytrium polystomum]